MADRTPVIFIHGLWLHATSWAPWLDLFAEYGYQPIAPGWPGDGPTVEETRRHAAALNNVGIDEVTRHYADLIATLTPKPILIGHSVGGLLAQKLLGEGHGAAAIAIDAPLIGGVLPVQLSWLHATLPVFRNPANRHRAVSLTAEQFHYAFGNALPPEESNRLYRRWAIPAPARALVEAATATFSWRAPAQVPARNGTRGLLLLITGGHDHTVPGSITGATLELSRHLPAVTDLQEFTDRGHSLTIDHGWCEVAEHCLSWLDAQEL